MDAFYNRCANFGHVDVALDLQHHHLVMYSIHGKLIGGMRFILHHEAPAHARVVNAVTAVSGEGYGTFMYLNLITALGERGITLSPDPTSVKGCAASVWAKLWSSDHIVKSPLPCHIHADEHNLIDSHALTTSNPAMSRRMIKRLTNGDPQRLREFILSEKLNPHPYNYGYSLRPDSPLSPLLSGSIEYRSVNMEELFDHDRLWEQRYLYSHQNNTKSK